jgi:hypothetical protein
MVDYAVGLENIPSSYGILQLEIIEILAYAYTLFNISGGNIMLSLRKGYQQLVQFVHYA